MARFLVMFAVAMTCLACAPPVILAAQPDPSSTPEIQAAAMKQHLERWLEVHRPDLSSNAQALVREAIDFVTPAMYAGPPTEADRHRQAVLSERLGCALGNAHASTLMRRDRPPQRVSQTWGERTREWVDWFVNCAVP